MLVHSTQQCKQVFAVTRLAVYERVVEEAAL